MDLGIYRAVASGARRSDWVALIAAESLASAIRQANDELRRQWPGVDFHLTVTIAYTDYPHIMLAAQGLALVAQPSASARVAPGVNQPVGHARRDVPKWRRVLGL